MSGGDVSHNSRAPKGRWALLTAAAVAGLAIGGGAYAWRSRQATPPASLVTQQPAIGGDFQLVDVRGRPVDQRLLLGKWSAVFFGFTHCPDVCPATLQTLQAATEQLGPQAADLQVVFITVDPERDTPEALGSYLSGFEFRGGVHGLTGSPEQVDAAAKAWRAYYRKRGEGADYSMDHVTTVYLMDPQGRFSKPLTRGLDPKSMAEQISAAMRA